MAPNNIPADRDLECVLSALKHASEFKIDYHALAQDQGLTTAKPANTAQKEFKAAVERSGKYKLLGGRVVENGAPSTTDTAAATVASAADVATTDDDDDAPPPKRRKATSKGTPKKK